MKMYKTLSFDCLDCNGEGFIYWGNADDYDVESCECVTKGVAK